MCMIINVNSDMKLVEQIYSLASKNKNEKIYISDGVMAALMLECNKLLKFGLAKRKLLFKEDRINYALVFTEVHNKVLEHSFNRLDRVRKFNGNTAATIEEYDYSILNLDYRFFLCVKDEYIGEYAKCYDRNKISDFI